MARSLEVKTYLLGDQITVHQWRGEARPETHFIDGELVSTEGREFVAPPIEKVDQVVGPVGLLYLFPRDFTRCIRIKEVNDSYT